MGRRVPEIYISCIYRSHTKRTRPVIEVEAWDQLNLFQLLSLSHFQYDQDWLSAPLPIANLMKSYFQGRSAPKLLFEYFVNVVNGLSSYLFARLLV